jgi:hypothetical protein
MAGMVAVVGVAPAVPVGWTGPGTYLAAVLVETFHLR